MKTYSSTTLATLAMASSLVLAGCGQSSTAEPAGGTDAASVSATPAATKSTPAPTVAAGSAGPADDFVVNLEDKDGYKFDVAVKVNVFDLGETTANDKPGYMSSEFKVNLDIDLINRTPGRTIKFQGVGSSDFQQPKFMVSAVYDPGSPICQPSGSDGLPCYIRIGYGMANVQLPAEATVSLKTYKGSPDGVLKAGMRGIPEADWPTVKEALKSPAYFLISYDGKDGQTRFGCELDASMGFLIASSQGDGCVDDSIKGGGYPPKAAR